MRLVCSPGVALINVSRRSCSRDWKPGLTCANVVDVGGCWSALVDLRRPTDGPGTLTRTGGDSNPRRGQGTPEDPSRHGAARVQASWHLDAAIVRTLPPVRRHRAGAPPISQPRCRGPVRRQGMILAIGPRPPARLKLRNLAAHVRERMLLDARIVTRFVTHRCGGSLSFPMRRSAAATELKAPFTPSVASAPAASAGRKGPNCL